jgi:hypothetical protein
VTGYSVNDSVVVFDRIRERLRGRIREPLAKLANDACLQTIPRTINTGLGALFILAALFLLGGDTLTDFALALLVGIGVGTWSSVFVATPLLVVFEERFGEPAPAREPVAEPVATGSIPKARGGGAGRQGTGARPRPQRPRPTSSRPAAAARDGADDRRLPRPGGDGT